MKKKLLLYLGFFGVLLGTYYFFIFTQTDINQSGLTVINANIGPFVLTDQNGKTVTEKTVEGKVYVAEYFFTTCKGICPKMNANMRRVYDQFKNQPGFMILSHTCMPETDSVSVLKKYEKKMLTGLLKMRPGKIYHLEDDTTQNNIFTSPNNCWLFLTGEKKILYSLARHGYLLDNASDTTGAYENQFIHTQLFALVDKQSRVRGIYDGLKEDEIQKLLKDIPALLKENNLNRSLQ